MSSATFAFQVIEMEEMTSAAISDAALPHAKRGVRVF
jgi:hypothetical protein